MSDIPLNAILDNTPGNSVLAGGPCRVLAIDGEKYWLIDLGRKDPTKPNRTIAYVKGPRLEELAQLKEWLRVKKIFIHNVPSSISKNLTDADLRATAKTPRDRARVDTAIRHREQRWKILRPLITRKDKATKAEFFLSALDLLTDSKLREKIVKRAKASGNSITTVFGARLLTRTNSRFDHRAGSIISD